MMGKILGKPNGKAYRAKGVSDPVWWDDYAKTDTRQALKRELAREMDAIYEVDAETFAEIERIISNPTEPNDALRRLMSTPAPWEMKP